MNLNRKSTSIQYLNSLPWEVEQEINQSTTIEFHSQNLWFTRNHIVSNLRGLDVILLGDVVHVYGLNSNSIEDKNNSIVVVTKDGVRHVIVTTSSNALGEATFYKVLEQIGSSLPNVVLGFENGFFKTSGEVTSVDVDTPDLINGVKSNIFLGIIGAILGACIGVVIWVVVGMLGYVAGIAGFAMIYFAINGYRLFSGFLDKKGQIISLVVALVMIFVANVMLFALLICKATLSSYGVVEVINAMKQLPNTLKEFNLIGDFARDLCLGYVLSFYSASKIIKTIFSS